jgi:hypothetical protein
MRYWFGLLTLCLLAFAACHGSSGLPPRGTSNAGLQVAAVGDSDAQMAQSIRNIENSGAHPVYVTLKAPQRSYDVSPYAQILLSGGIVIVRTARIRVFRQSDVTIYYDGNPVDVSTIPVTNAFVIDRLADNHGPGAFQKGNLSNKRSTCPDCVVVMGNSRNVRKAAARWNGLVDPWQQAPTYVAWAPTPLPSSGIAPLSVIKPQSCFRSCGGGGGPNCSSHYCCPSGQYQDGAFGCRPYYYYSSYSYSYFDPPGCNTSTSTFSRQQRTESVVTGTQAITQNRLTQDRLSEVQREAFARIIPDSAVDENIDPQIQGADREAIRKAMLSLPTFARQNVEVEDAHGHYYANREASYAAHARLHPWRYLGNGLWEDSHGENAARPEAESATANHMTSNSAIRTMSDTPCPPSGGLTTGGYVAGYTCDVSNFGSVSANVDASSVSGPPGPDHGWCVVPGEVGYLLVSAYTNSQGIDAGLQWSSYYYHYAMYFYPFSGTGPSGSFQPGAFSMTLGTTGDGYWWLYVYAASGGSAGTYLQEPTGKAQGSGPWTFEHCTCLAQALYDPGSGSYWGYKPYAGPLFTWSAENPAPAQWSQKPNVAEAVRVGPQEGIWMWW